MSAKSNAIRLLCAILAVFSTSCVVREKVTVNGEVREEGYVVKRPLKDALDNSQ